jgi:7-carboxy-7-deazaguanine synthase
VTGGARLDTSNSLLISETFGPTVQGEGPSTGRRCSFVRLGACNLSCSWCDTPYTWDASRFDLREELSRVPVTDVVNGVLAHKTPLVVITGGEPLLQQKHQAWHHLVDCFHVAGLDVEIETNGTLRPHPFTTERVTRYNVSPKLTHAGDPLHKRIRPDVLCELNATGKAIFKFVCRTGEDVDEAAAIASSNSIPSDRVWIMPEGTHRHELTHRMWMIADRAIGHGFNLTGRLHVAVWGNDRGH